MSDVPDELLREILSRLPVAPLLRFRCACKSWKGLIDSDEFTKHHLNHSRKSNSNLNIFLKSLCIYSADFDLLNETNVATFKQLSHPLNTPSGYTNILGSCDGLLVLRNHDNDITILWNPSVKRFHMIPCTTSIEIPEYYKMPYHGFGYDVVSNDYKLIRITQFCGKDVEVNSEVKVYSLKSDSWRTIPDFPYHLVCVMNKGVLANGALHWMVTEKVKSGNLVAALDLGTEEYRLVPLPKFARDNATCMYMAELGGCLSLLGFVNQDCVIWVMKEYGVEESWSFLLTCDDFVIPYTLRPLAYSKCGRKVLLFMNGDVMLRWYDLDKKSTDIPMVEMPSENAYDMFTCLQSLVLFNNGTCDYDLLTKNNKGRTKRENLEEAMGEPVKTVISP